MISELIIDGAGRVTLPAELREELNLEPGDVLLLEAGKDRICCSRFVHPAPLSRKMEYGYTARETLARSPFLT